MERKLVKLFTPSRKQNFIFLLIEDKDFINFCNKNLIVFSDIERFLNFKHPQPDLRELLFDFVELKILVPIEKDRHGYWQYQFDKKELINLIYNSALTNNIKNIIHKMDAFAIT